MVISKKFFLPAIFTLLFACKSLPPEVRYQTYLLEHPYYGGSKSDHFDGKRFISEVKKTSLNERIRFFFTPEDNWDNDWQEGLYPRINDFKEVEKARVTFIGHATFLIQLPNVNILTDPIWSERAGMITMQPFGIKRHHQPPVELENLPKIHYVLLSSNSYYHMDIPTIKRLVAHSNPKFITGLGNCYYLEKIKKLNLECFELDWGKKIVLSDSTEFIFTKSLSYSQRSWFDLNKTLWGSFVIKAPDFRIFFAGLTAYSPHMREISGNHGPFDLALLPIGGYQPEWLMARSHMTPEEAIKSHIVLNSQKSIAMQFNTFQISSEGYYDSKIAAEQAKATYGLYRNEFVIPKFGEVFEF